MRARLAYLGVALLASSVTGTDLVLSSGTVLPGQTLRFEVNGLSPDTRLQARFQSGKYPLYVVGPSAQRGLIGIALGSEPGTFPLEIIDISKPGGPYPTVSKVDVVVASRTYTIENVNFTKQKTDLMRAERRESALIGQRKKYLSRDQLWEGLFAEPVHGPVIGEFGLKRLRNGKIEAGFHKGVDLRASEGTPILAPNNGVVLMASTLKAHGKTVMLNHGQGVVTIFLHMSKLGVHPGQKVKKGDVIGWVGATGLATAPHLHWQLYVHGVPVDPDQWLQTEY